MDGQTARQPDGGRAVMNPSKGARAQGLVAGVGRRGMKIEKEEERERTTMDGRTAGLFFGSV